MGVVRSDTEGNTGRIAKETARLGFRQKCLRFHRNCLRSAHLTVGHGGANDERLGMSFDSGVESLVGADDDGEALAKFRSRLGDIPAAQSECSPKRQRRPGTNISSDTLYAV